MQNRFKNIFGLSAKAPECFTTETAITKAEIETSDSGLYLDELDDLNLNMAGAAFDCSEGNIFELMDKAKKNALLELQTSLLAGLSGTAKQRRTPFIGLIGSEASKGTVAASDGDVLRLILKPTLPKSVILKIKRIGLLLDSDAVVQVNIPTTGQAFEVVTAARTPSYYQFPKGEELIINLSDEYGTANQVEFNYTVQGFRPLANLASCGCGQRDQVLGAFFEGGSIISQQANGILLDVEITCDPKNVIILNYEQNPAASAVLAKSALLKTAELLIERINSSDNINRYTMLDSQYLWGKRNHFRKEYQDRISWLLTSEGLDLSKDSCFVCKSPSGLKRVGIM